MREGRLPAKVELANPTPSMVQPSVGLPKRWKVRHAATEVVTTLAVCPLKNDRAALEFVREAVALRRRTRVVAVAVMACKFKHWGD